MLADDIFKEIVLLKENWNDNGAKPFDKDLIEKSKNFLFALPETLRESCFIAPTACGSIQFEWEKEQEYYEVEVYNDFIKLFVVEGDTVKKQEVFYNKEQILNVTNFLKENKK